MGRMKNTLSLVTTVILALQMSFAAAEPAAHTHEVWYDWQGNIVVEKKAESSNQVQPSDLAEAPKLTKFVPSPLDDRGDRSRQVRTYFDYPHAYWHGCPNSCYPIHRSCQSQPRFFLWYSRQGNWGVTGRSLGAVRLWHR